jgi:hypothetical protein
VISLCFIVKGEGHQKQKEEEKVICVFDQIMAKKAVLIGCNYPGTKAELKGCINDVKKTYRCLVDRYGFSKDDITVLIDTDDSYTQPTGKNIRRALADLLRSAEPGDFLFVHYSGHGTRLPAETGEDDDTGYDECIVPADMNLITGRSFFPFFFIAFNSFTPLGFLFSFFFLFLFFISCLLLFLIFFFKLLSFHGCDFRSPCPCLWNSRKKKEKKHFGIFLSDP